MIASALLFSTTGVSASHLDTMAVSASSSDLQVTLHVQYTTTGSCCGGTFSWTTGDGASGSLADGTSSGVYGGDASGSGSLSDGRSFTWTRSGPSPVQLDITYSYNAYGTYTIDWQDCCPDKSGSLQVTLSSGGGGGGGDCREVGVETEERDAGAYVFVGTVRVDVTRSIPAVGGGVCIPEGL